MNRLGLIFLVAASLSFAACAGDAASNPATPPRPSEARTAAQYLAATPEIRPVRFPEDEAPHDMLTEWWYYTGHMFTPDGARYGFEYVIFQAQRGAFPPFFAAHFAITDSASQRFVFDERSGTNAIQPAEQGFSLNLDGWTMSGALGQDRLVADMEDFAIDLTLTATKPPALHGGNGYVDFGAAGGSYYYSRTRMQVSGELTVDGARIAVTGESWMDHQWGNFITVGAGGWDWFSVQLATGEDLTISLILGADKQVVASYGTLIGADGRSVHLEPDDFRVEAVDYWTSPHSGATYPSGWTFDLPDRGWSLALVPSMNDQELRTTATTGVTYWEGEVEVAGMVGGTIVAGLGYVELTGYATPEANP